MTTHSYIDPVTKKEFTFVLPERLSEVPKVYGEANSMRATSASVLLPAPIGGLGELKCNPAAADAFRLLFERLDREGLYETLETITQAHGNVNWWGAFPPVRSMRAWGAGVLINEGHNRDGYMPPSERQLFEFTQQEGRDEKLWDDTVFYPDHPVVRVAREIGFQWGGDRPRQYIQPAAFELCGEKYRGV